MSPPEREARVLVVYLGGDNNLEDFAYQKLAALRDGRNDNPYDKIAVYMDTGHSGASLIEIAADKNLVTLANYPAENSASPEVFGRVLADVARLYPDSRYGLLLFSHATGWLPEGALDNPYGTRSVIVDDSHDAEMSLTGIADAIPRGMFDYIVFEACFMGGIEVAYQLRDKTPLILASSAEIVDPGFTNIYSSATSLLQIGDVESFAHAAYSHIVTTYSVGELQRSATFSIINTEKLDALASFIKENCDLSEEVDIADIQHFDRNTDHRLFFDFEDYYTRTLIDETKQEELSAMIKECVVYKAATPEFMTQQQGFHGFHIDKYSGLTTYIPQPQFRFLNAYYTGLTWYRAIVE